MHPMFIKWSGTYSWSLLYFHLMHFPPCGTAFRSDAFFLICSYSRRWRWGQRSKCSRERSVASRKHMRWVADVSRSASTQTHAHTRSLQQRAAGRCGSAPRSLRGEFVKLFACRGGFLNPFKRSLASTELWKDICVSLWITGSFKWKKWTLFFLLFFGATQTPAVDSHHFKGVFILRSYSASSGFYNKCFIVFIPLFFYALRPGEYLNLQVTAEYKSTAFLVFVVSTLCSVSTNELSGVGDRPSTFSAPANKKGKNSYCSTAI